MKRLCLCLLTAAMTLPVWAKDAASVSSDPSPAVVGREVTVTVTLTSASYSSPVYIYSWAVDGNNSKLGDNATWDGSVNQKFQMTGSGKTWSYTITDMASFFSLSTD